MPSEGHFGRREHLLRSRARMLQPLLPCKGKVLEFRPRDALNLAALQAETKIAWSDREASFFPSDVQVSASIPDGADFDLIICDQALEYLTDPRTPLSELKTALKPGGKILVLALYDPAFRRPKDQSSAAHFYSWNVQTLGNLLVDCGYEFVSGAVERDPRDRSLYVRVVAALRET